MTLHLKSRGYPFRPRLLFSSFIVVGVGFPNCVLFQERTHFTERFFSQEVEVIETEYLFGEPIYTTYPVRSGECSVQLSSEDSDITIVARNKAGETKTRLLRSHTVNPIKVIVDGNIVTVKSEVPISSCQIQSVMSMENFQVSQSDQYTCSGTVDKEGKFIATAIDQSGDVHTVRFIVR